MIENKIKGLFFKCSGVGANSHLRHLRDSLVGRASAWHAESRRFKFVKLHSFLYNCFSKRLRKKKNGHNKWGAVNLHHHVNMKKKMK